MTRVFKKQELIDVGLPYNAIDDVITEQSRWSTYHKIVFEFDGKYYETEYSEGSTECQNESPWQYEDEIHCTEVEKREVKVEKWISVDVQDKPHFESVKAESEYMNEIKNDIDAEKTIKIMHELQEDAKRLIDICEQSISEYQQKVHEYKVKLENDIKPLQDMLFAYMQSCEVKETKTQYSYKLPSATLKYTKSKKDYDRDNETLTKWCKSNCESYIKTKESVDWVNLKKQLEIVGDKAIVKGTGEVVEGVKVIEKEGKFDISC